MTVQQDIDRMCNWYELNKPDVKTIRVNTTRETVYKFAGNPGKGKPIRYRGFEVICLKKSSRDSIRDATQPAQTGVES